jgi:hypothetical protein
MLGHVQIAGYLPHSGHLEARPEMTGHRQTAFRSQLITRKLMSRNVREKAFFLIKSVQLYRDPLARKKGIIKKCAPVLLVLRINSSAMSLAFRTSIESYFTSALYVQLRITTTIPPGTASMSILLLAYIDPVSAGTPDSQAWGATHNSPSFYKGDAMHNARFGRISLAGLLVPFLFPFHALAEVDCATLPHWVALDNGLQMNQQHVFCGEWINNRPKGFHSRPGGVNPAAIQKFTVQDRPNSAGIYTGKWSYNNESDKSKFSSMFPDNCSTEQVLNSISHASAHPDLNCPAGSPGWVKCGKNRPASVAKEELSGYCSIDQKFFSIGFAAPKNDKINTAFPIRQ